MTKVLTLLPDGTLNKKPRCALYDGIAERRAVANLGQFAEMLLQLRPDEALCYGVTAADNVRVVTQERLASTPGAIARDREHMSFRNNPGIMMFDYDPAGEALAPGKVIEILRTALPEAADVELVVRPSASSCIYHEGTDEELCGIRGLRLWMIVSDASEIPRIGEILHDRLWALGHGEFRVSRSGAMLDRTTFDVSVWQPERLDFAAGAQCSRPLVQRRPPPEIVHGSKERFAVPPKLELSPEHEREAKSRRSLAKKLKEPEAARVRQAFIDRRAREMATERNIAIDTAARAIRQALETKDLYADFVLYGSGGPVTVGEILANPSKYDSSRFADPLEPDYQDDDRVAMVKLFDRPPYLWSHAHGGQRFVLHDAAAPLGARPRDAMDELNSQYALVPIGHQVYVVRRTIDDTTGLAKFDMLRKESFSLLMRNQARPDGRSGSLGDYWLDHPKRKTFAGIEFHPECTTPGHLNLFQGFPYRPVPGETTKFWSFVQEVICAGNEDSYKYTRNYLAHLFQMPATLPATALVLRGGQGAGKNTFVDAIGELVGKHFVPLTSTEQLTGRFTGHMKDALLVHANEASWGGNKSQAGALKSMITEASVPIEQKGIDIFNVRNFRRLIVSSNESWVVPADLDDRRFVFLNVSNDRANDIEYFRQIREELKNGGYSALMHDLMTEDISGFDSRQRPDTGFGFDVKLKTAAPLERWLYNVLEEGEFPMPSGTDEWPLPWQDRINKKGVYMSYAGACQRVARHATPDDAATFHKTLKRILPSLKESRTATKSVPPQPPGSGQKAVVREREYVLPKLEDARTAFEQHMHAAGQIQWAPLDDAGD